MRRMLEAQNNNGKDTWKKKKNLRRRLLQQSRLRVRTKSGSGNYKTDEYQNPAGLSN